MKRKKCIKCEEKFDFNLNEDSYWDYKGVTPTKLVKCPHCNCIQAIRYIKVENVNYDERYYITK